MTETAYDPSGFFTVKIIQGGRITIPEATREAFKIREGDTVTFRYVRTVKKMEVTTK